MARIKFNLESGAGDASGLAGLTKWFFENYFAEIFYSLL